MRTHRFPAFVFTLLAAVAAFFAPHSALAQAGANIQYQVANLMEDMRLLDERMRLMTVQMDDMRRENERMRQLISNFEADADRNLGKFATISQLNEAIRVAALKLEARDDEINRKTVAEVGKTIDEFAKRVERAIGGMTAPRPPTQAPKVFNKTGIPGTGTPYVVQPGDTLSSIAQKHGSRVDWIQNINEISDPRAVQVGQTLFIPQQ